jgi:hypothetical protein
MDHNYIAKVNGPNILWRMDGTAITGNIMIMNYSRRGSGSGGGFEIPV